VGASSALRSERCAKGLANNVWGIAGLEREAKLNVSSLQPFINLNFTQRWALSFAPLITSNWSASKGHEMDGNRVSS
jgi:hypothetical protein